MHMYTSKIDVKIYCISPELLFSLLGSLFHIIHEDLSIKSKAHRYGYSCQLAHSASSLSLPSKTATTPTNIFVAFYVGSGDPNSSCPCGSVLTIELSP